MMKKIILSITLLTLILFAAYPVFAVKPVNNLAGAQEVAWNLSGEVMPVPPYGSRDIPGSDDACKLILNQPNGAVEVALTGVMKQLNPNTEYTVYLSKAYTPYQPTNVVGTYKWLVLSTYEHDLIITTQNPDGTFSGIGGYPAGNEPYDQSGETSEIITGQVVGNQITFTTDYQGPYNPTYSVTVAGTINPDGSITGNSPWEWHTTYSEASLASGSTSWPGLFTNTIQPFTFMTDEYGTASWHLNLKDANFPDAGTYSMSVWINEAGRTMLISNVFSVEVD